MYLPSSTEGQLYRALVVWAEHWIQEGRYTSLQEAIAEFIPRLEEVSSLSPDRQLCRIEFEHMGVREFLSYVVPSNTLDSEQFRARCIDVMQVGELLSPALVTWYLCPGQREEDPGGGAGPGGGASHPHTAQPQVQVTVCWTRDTGHVAVT